MLQVDKVRVQHDRNVGCLFARCDDRFEMTNVTRFVTFIVRYKCYYSSVSTSHAVVFTPDFNPRFFLST